MARLALPRNAWRIAERLPDVPTEPVVVSFVGEHAFAGETVFCDPGKAYEWAWAVGRKAVVLVRPGVDATQCIRGLFRWCQLYPTLIDVERRAAASVIAIEPRLRLWRIPSKEVFPCRC